MGNQIGEGGFGQIFLAFRISDGLPVAVKSIPKPTRLAVPKNGLAVPLEFYIMKTVEKVPGTIKILNIYQGPKSWLGVMNLPPNSQDLFEYIKKFPMNCLPEQLVKHILKQLTTTLIGCLKWNIYHRDLKEENILIDQEGLIHLIDFGLSRISSKETKHKTFAGTLVYASPEQVLDGYSKSESHTVWSLGILAFSLLFGCPPFPGVSILQAGALCNLKVPFPRKTTEKCENWIRGCLCYDPTMRPSLEDLSKHEFLAL